MHPRIGVDLDQPDAEVLGDHEVGPVQLEAAAPSVHEVLGGEHRQHYRLRHLWVDPLVVRLALVAQAPVTYTRMHAKPADIYFALAHLERGALRKPGMRIKDFRGDKALCAEAVLSGWTLLRLCKLFGDIGFDKNDICALFIFLGQYWIN